MITATHPAIILEHIQSRSSHPWLLDPHHTPLDPNFTQTFEHHYQQFQKTPSDTPLIIADPNPIQFLAQFLAACATQRTVLLGNPNWVQAEWEQVQACLEKAEGRRQKAEKSIQNISYGDATRFWDAKGYTKFKIQTSNFPNAPTSQSSDAPTDALRLSPNTSYADWELNPQLPNPQRPTPQLSNSPTDALRLSPNTSYADSPSKIQNPKSKIQNPNILIPTGGTSGTLRFAIHTWDTLTASVRGFQQHFQVEPINTFCVLPLYHVSGLMQFMRSFLTNGQMIISTCTQMQHSDSLDMDCGNYFLSLVPTQLARFYQTPRLMPFLRRFKAILLGGAPPWPDLLNTARQLQLPLAPTYGMTETASQVATLRPNEFLSAYPKAIEASDGSHYGNNAGSVLPHAQIWIQDPSGQTLPAYKTGLITIQAQSLALGYCSPNGLEMIGAGGPLASDRMFQSNDLGFLDEDGALHIVGRQRDMIISGGENIASSEVEAAIRATGLVKDVAVIGVSDRLWGEAVTAIYVPCERGEQGSKGEEGQEVESIKAALAGRLNRIKYPKHWIAVVALPCNEQGKVNRVELRAIAHSFVEGFDR